MIDRFAMLAISAVMLAALGGCISVVEPRGGRNGDVPDDRRMAEEDNIPVRGETPGKMCRADGLSSFVGQQATAEMGANILRQSNAARLRWIRPDDAVTADYRQDRINVKLSDTIVVTGFNCG